MRIINILGIIYFFAPIAYKYKSLRASIITINGILYHSNETNKYLQYYDIISNMLMCIYTYKYNKYDFVSKYILLSSGNFVLNTYLFKQKYISHTTNDIYHVLFVQRLLSIGLEKTCKMLR